MMKTMNNDKSFFDTFEVIHTYTRKKGIDDGVLVDMTQDKFGELLRAAGFNRHMAMTATAFDQVIGDTDRLPEGQDIARRWWDVLNVMKVAITAAIRKTPSHRVDSVPFQVKVWNGKRHDTVSLYVHCGPGDNAEPVLTIMLEGED
jgi:hypothetical protein